MCRFKMTTVVSFVQTRWETKVAVSSCTARRASQGQPPSVWPTSCVPIASSWTRLLSSSSSAAVSSHPTSALWVSCCSSSHRFSLHPPALRRRAAQHSAKVALFSTFLSLSLSMPVPVRCPFCPIIVLSPLHQPADRTFPIIIQD